MWVNLLDLFCLDGIQIRVYMKVRYIYLSKIGKTNKKISHGNWAQVMNIHPLILKLEIENFFQFPYPLSFLLLINRNKKNGLPFFIISASWKSRLILHK